jgi:hypothetical protein
LLRLSLEKEEEEVEFAATSLGSRTTFRVTTTTLFFVFFFVSSRTTTFVESRREPPRESALVVDDEEEEANMTSSFFRVVAVVVVVDNLARGERSSRILRGRFKGEAREEGEPRISQRTLFLRERKSRERERIKKAPTRGRNARAQHI